MKNPSAGWKQALGRLTSVAAATALLCWPALWSRFPLLFVDSYEYIYTGRGIMQKLLGQAVPYGYSSYASNRSEIFSAGLFLVDGGTSLWRFIVLQSLLTAWVIWLVVRSLSQRCPATVYLTLAALLSVFTSVAWYTSYVMPDILGPVLYLSLYLLIFAMQTLRRWELAGVLLLTVWCLAAHTTHFIVAVSLCGLFILLWLFKWKPIRRSGRSIVLVAAVIALAAAAQIGVHQRLYGEPTLLGNAPPFAMARLISDGPALLYLQQHCKALDWAICAHLPNLSAAEGDLLWRPDGVWMTASPEEKRRLRAEQVPLLFATVHTYPVRQLAMSFSNFAHLLVTIGPSDFGHYLIFTPRNLDLNIEDSSRDWERSRQAHDGMPQRFFRLLQLPILVLCALAVALLLLFYWRTLPIRLAGLSVVVLFTVLTNAFIAGVLSGPFARYQGRIAWLVPLLAGLLAWHAWTHRSSAQETRDLSREQ